jgi:hypothetical protein
MIGQYLSNTNEKYTVSILQNILELNKAIVLSFFFLAHESSWTGVRTQERSIMRVRTHCALKRWVL